MSVEGFLSRLRGVRQSGGGWVARCPAHEDRQPSLSVHQVNGTILLHCFAGCSFGQIVAALGMEERDFFPESGRDGGSPVACYDYNDETSALLFQVVRFAPKEFRVRRPDGKGGWAWSLDGVRRVPYKLPEVLKSPSVLVVEGEKDCETARNLGLVGTCNPGGAGKWKPEYSECLRGKHVAIIADKDEPGRKHAHAVARSLVGIAEIVKLIELPGAKDLSEWAGNGGTRERLLEIIKAEAELTGADVAAWPDRGTVESKPETRPTSPWDLAESVSDFLSSHFGEIEAIEPKILYRSSVTELFAPRGFCKSLWVIGLAIRLAKAGKRVFLLDRDNPRPVLHERLEGWGAENSLPNLKVLSREECPPLTNAIAWGQFPYSEFDVVIVDSLDSHAEGIGEQDSAKPSRAIAPLLDVAHREGGPAVLVLGNCVRSAKHSRGSGVVEDRADVVYEVRDVTDFKPSGNKAWVEELPPADAGSWASRSTRRQRRETYRLAFVPSKFRIAEEPEPFILELDLRTCPWSCRDVTDDVDKAGAEARAAREREQSEKVSLAVKALNAEIARREQQAQPPLLKNPAIDFLRARGLTRTLARQTVNSGVGTQWQIVTLEGQKGHPQALINGMARRNITSTEPAKTLSKNDTHFGGAVSMHPAEIDPAEARVNGGSQEPPISADDSVYSPPLRSEQQAKGAGVGAVEEEL